MVRSNAEMGYLITILGAIKTPVSLTLRGGSVLTQNSLLKVPVCDPKTSTLTSTTPSGLNMNKAMEIGENHLSYQKSKTICTCQFIRLLLTPYTLQLFLVSDIFNWNCLLGTWTVICYFFLQKKLYIFDYLICLSHFSVSKKYILKRIKFFCDEENIERLSFQTKWAL